MLLVRPVCIRPLMRLRSPPQQLADDALAKVLEPSIQAFPGCNGLRPVIEFCHI